MRAPVTAALPVHGSFDAVLDDAADEQVDEQRDPGYGYGDVPCGKVGAGYPGVEAPEGSNPEEQDDVALPTGQPRQAKSQSPQAEEQQHVEDAPQRQRDGLREEQGQVLRPAFHH